MSFKSAIDVPGLGCVLAIGLFSGAAPHRFPSRPTWWELGCAKAARISMMVGEGHLSQPYSGTIGISDLFCEQAFPRLTCGS